MPGRCVPVARIDGAPRNATANITSGTQNCCLAIPLAHMPGMISWGAETRWHGRRSPHAIDRHRSYAFGNGGTGVGVGLEVGIALPRHWALHGSLGPGAALFLQPSLPSVIGRKSVSPLLPKNQTPWFKGGHMPPPGNLVQAASSCKAIFAKSRKASRSDIPSERGRESSRQKVPTHVPSLRMSG
jgi:hypothetical protein